MPDGELNLRDYVKTLDDLPAAQLKATTLLNEVVAAVLDTKKAGSVTVKLTIAPGKLDDTTIEVVPDVKAAIPEPTLKGGVFYPDSNNNLTKNDPNAMFYGDDIRSAPTFVAGADDKIKGAPTE